MSGIDGDAEDRGHGDETAGEWWLAGAVQPSNPQSSIEFVGVRQLEGEELTQVRDANAFVFRLASAHSYQRLVDLFQHLLSARATSASPKRDALEMSRAASALAQAASAFAEELLDRARKDLSGEPDKLATLVAAVNAEASQLPFRLLLGVADLDTPLFVADGANIVNSPEAIAALRVSVPEAGLQTNVIVAFAKAVMVAQRMLAHFLNAYWERIEEASRIIRLLAADVLEGGPGLIHYRDAGEAGDKMQMTPEPLNLDSAAALVQAHRLANDLLEKTTEAEAAKHADPPESAVTEPPEENESGTLDAAQSDATAEASDVDGAALDQVLDLRALGAHASELTELERVWSAALDQEEVAAALAEMEGKFATLLHVVRREVTASDQEVADKGVETILPAYPLPDEELTRVTFAPDAERKLSQLRLAQVDAIIDLTRVIELMRHPRGTRITLDGGLRRETWWEAGSFLLVREHLERLIRLTEAADEAAAALLGQSDSQVDAAQLMERLALAGKARMHGDLEAALIHAALAIRARAHMAGRPPPDLLRRLADDERLGAKRIVLSRLQEALEALSRGESIDLGATQIIVPPLLDLTRRLCLEDPQPIIDAVEKSNADG